VVYRVVHAGLGRDLALKYALNPLTDGDPARGLIAEEARVLAGIPDHPGLVRVHDLDLHDGHLYLVMDFVRGRTLAQFARDHRPGPRQSAALVAEAARAVGAAHRCGAVHQDIKPKNILVDERGHARLIDFGIARLRHAWSGGEGEGTGEEGPSGGTPGFMAPEQARGADDQVGPRSDVFGLGAVLYSLLTGRPPFAAADRRAALERAARCDFDRPALRAPGVPRRLARVVLRAMAADPAARHPTAEALADDLEAFLGRPRRVAGQAGALLLAAIAAGAWSLRPRPARDADRAAPPVTTAPSPTPGRVPLTVESFLVELHRQDPPASLGPVGLRAFAGQFGNDAVRVRARLSGPAYCYLIALNPDGTVQPCSPEGPAAAPPRSDEVVYPSNPGDGFHLTDGVGTQAFVLVASHEPLPPLADWLRAAGALPWAKTGSEAVWRYDGRGFEAVVERAERGPVGPLADLPGPLEAACRALQSRPGVAAIQALAFPVKPRPASDRRATPAPGASSPAAGDLPDNIIVTDPRGVQSAKRISPPSRVSGFFRAFRGVPDGLGRRLAEPALPERRGTERVLVSFGDGATAVRLPPETA
jgi:hypothetical protein